MSASGPLIPREHGAWAVLFVPLFAGGTIAGSLTVNVTFLALSALGVFMSHLPVQTILKHYFVTKQPDEKLDPAIRWASLYLGIGVICMIPLLARGYWLLLAIGAAGVIAFLSNFFLTSRNGRSIPSDVLAVFGLTLSGLCGYYVVAGRVDMHAFVVWLLLFLFFCCSVFYVQMKIRATALKKPDMSLSEKLSLGTLNIVYHVAVIALVIVLAIFQQTGWFTALVFIPMSAHAFYGTFTLSRKVQFRKLGFLLLGQSLLFGVLLWMVVP